MDKKLLLIGMVVIIAGLLIVGMESPSNIMPPTDYQQLSLRPGGVMVIPLPMNSTGLFTVVFGANNTVSFFLFNSTAFRQIRTENQSADSIFNQAVSFEGRGTMAIIYNKTSGLFPYSNDTASNGEVQPPFYSSNTIMFDNETYYMVFANTANTVNYVHYSTIIQYITPEILQTYTKDIYTSGLPGAFAVMIGFVIVIISVFRGNKKAENLNEAQIGELYKKIDTSERKKPRRTKQKKR